jgi:integrase
MTIRQMLRTVDVYTVSRILGHQSLEATLVYLHANDPDEGAAEALE